MLTIYCCIAPMPKISGITSLTFGTLPGSSLFLLSECGFNGNALLIIKPQVLFGIYLFLILPRASGKKETIEFSRTWKLFLLLWLLEFTMLSKRTFSTPTPTERMTPPFLLSRRIGILSIGGKLIGTLPTQSTKPNSADKILYGILPYGMDQNQSGWGS